MPARPRTSRRQLAEMSLLLRAVLDDIAAAGGMKGKVHREALDLVDAYVRGQPPAPEAIDAARAAIAKLTGQIGPGSSRLLLALSHVPVELVLRMVERGEDLSEPVMKNAELAVVGSPPGGVAKRIAELRARAAEAAASIDDTPIPARRNVVPEGPLDLPPIALAHLASRSASRSGEHGGAGETEALLAKCGYPAYPAVLAFEEAFGGLEIVESDPYAPALAVGPFAFFSALPRYTGKHEDLVPVAIASNDVYYALDAAGRGFTCAAMVEGVFRPSASDGRALVTQAILWRALETHPASFVTKKGRHGEALAKERGVAAIPGASGDTERWWGSTEGMVLVVEIDRGNGFTEPMTFATGG